MTISQADWEAKGRELFGNDKAAWRFHCPACHDELSMAEAREKYPELKGCGWSPGQECIGRHTDKVDCDWAAYGLFRGPLIIVANDDGREVAMFDFAGKPFTGRES
jgi:hypothetical protein